MPRKVFVAGEILTAADVNTNLADQAVMTFAGTAARGSAIASPSEGMVTYLEDTDQLEVYGGTAVGWSSASNFLFGTATPSEGQVATFSTAVSGYVPADVAGGLVDVKSVLKTDTFSASVAGGANAAVTDLSITHTLSDASNKLLLFAFFGMAASSDGRNRVGIAFADDGTLFGIPGASGSRTRTTAGAGSSPSSATNIASALHISVLHSPGDTAAHTYTVRAINADGATETVYINRYESNTDSAFNNVSASGFTLMEIAG